MEHQSSESEGLSEKKQDLSLILTMVDLISFSHKATICMLTSWIQRGTVLLILWQKKAVHCCKGIQTVHQPHHQQKAQCLPHL